MIAKEIANLINIEYNNKCLYKIKNITEQSKLNKKQRETNIEGAYELKRANKLKNKKIILLDDIYTTGSTANECCKILKQANIAKIDILTIAKD